MRVVIVGAGLGGLRTAESLRDKGYADQLLLLGDEAHMPYDRPPLSKHVLRGERDVMWLRPEDTWAELDVDVRVGTTATGLDLAARQVLTTAGPVEWDALVLATGAQPRRLPGAPGLVLRTLDDTRALAPYVAEGRRLAVIGAGLIGCEVAASARAKGAEVHVVDVLPEPMLRVLGPKVAPRMRAVHEQHGVRFHLGTAVEQATATSVALADGTELEVDAVLEAMGVVPATQWLEGSGLVLEDGIGCDGLGRAAEGVWAVGDVARWDGLRQEHWTSAVSQAATVAAGILGEHLPVTGPPYWWSDQYDVKLSGLGHPAPDDDVVVVDAGPRKRPLALYSRDGRLTGVVGFSNGALVNRLGPDVVAGRPVVDVVASVTG
jgi:3-phenylpropionate/trans-cinnamate dioxygenase ferredoxin reductase subunit